MFRLPCCSHGSTSTQTCFLEAGLFDTELDQSSQLVTNASIPRSVVQISWLRGLGRHENRRLLPQKSVLSVWPRCHRLFLPCCWCQMLTLRKATSDIDLFVSSTGECGRSASSRLFGLSCLMMLCSFSNQALVQLYLFSNVNINTLDHLKMNAVFVGNTWHFHNEIDFLVLATF